MHQSFTGSSRRQRQVNLSGRGHSNPWTSLSTSQKTSQPAAGTQNTLAHAQAERAQRQHERQRINAARKLQKTWRGYHSRLQTRQLWREKFDHVEEQRRIGDLRGLTLGPSYVRVAQGEANAPAYESTELCLEQLRLLVKFMNIHDSLDRMRLLYFGEALEATWIPQSSTDHNGVSHLLHQGSQVSFNLTRLGLLTARSLKNSLTRRPKASDYEKLFRLIYVLGRLTPDSLLRNADIYFSILSTWLPLSKSEPNWSSTYAFNLLKDLLQRPTGDRVDIYKAFVLDVLSSSALLDGNMLHAVGSLVDVENLLSAYSELLQQNYDQTQAAEKLLWWLAYFIHFIEQRTDISQPQLYDRSLVHVRIQSLSSLLSRCSEQIARYYDIHGEHLNGLTSLRATRLPDFVREKVDILTREESVARIMSDLGLFTIPEGNAQYSSNTETVVATDLAKYAVALLRAFPSKAVNIRRWLYQGTIKSTTRSEIPAIDFFWRAARATGVFRGICESQSNVLTLLKQPAAAHDQMSRPQPSKREEDIWRDEWQVILLFFELYTYILKPMDDEDFFGRQVLGSNSSISLKAGWLPLSDIETMTTFLKHMAFTLYWNAEDLSDSNAFENSGGLSAYFGMQGHLPKKADGPIHHQSLAGMDGVSQLYLKGLVTGLLRMIHERDSRRPFLPKTFWLMTTHVDMAGFISAVVAEEEKRHELGDEAEDEEDRWSEIFEAEDDLHAVPIDRPYLNFARPSRAAQARRDEHIERKRELARRKRQLESLAPRLEILRNLPFFVPFETRVQIFREFIKQDQLRRRDGHLDPDTWRMHTAMASRADNLLSSIQAGHQRIAQHRAEVHRDSIFQDAFESFYPLGEGLKEPIQISFIDKFGNPEAGIDGGGVTKEFLISVTNEAFDPKSDLAMFAENEQHEIYPNPTILESTVEMMRRMGIHHGTEDFKQHLRHFWQQFEFLGRIMGKCIYEGILVDINFAGFFLLKWALTGGTTAASNETAYRASINDVKDYDQGLYQGLVALKNYTGDVENDFGLNFSVTDTMSLNYDDTEVTHTITHDLVNGGSDIPVTKANREVYIDLIARYRLQTQPAFVTNAFLQGLGQIVQPMWLAMFNQKELQTLVGGENSELDIADLRRNTQYNGLYQIGDDGQEHPTIVLFWKVLQDMSDEDRRKILKFVTSTPRAPLLGFSHLTPPFTIHSTSASEGTERLPSTSTCVNLLKLPNYRDEKTMREKLLYAANSGAGFDLS